MKLGELLRDLPVLHAGADATAEVSSLAYNSREARPGTLFFAIHGEKADGHAYIPQALERGAVAVVSERPAPPELAARWIQVAAIRRALADAGRIIFGSSRKAASDSSESPAPTARPPRPIWWRAFWPQRGS